MKTYKITKQDIDQDGRYISPWSEFDGNVVIEGGLGCVRFEDLYAKGSIIAEAGSDIKVDGNLTAGEDIKVVESITVSGGVTAGGSISVGVDLVVGDFIDAGGAVKSGNVVTAGYAISAAWGVSAGVDLTVGEAPKK